MGEQRSSFAYQQFCCLVAEGEKGNIGALVNHQGQI